MQYSAKFYYKYQSEFFINKNFDDSGIQYFGNGN